MHSWTITSIKIISSWGPSHSYQSTVQTVTGPRFQYRETFTKSAEDDVSSHVLLPQIPTWPAHIWSAALSIMFFLFFPVCVERMSWTRRHSNTQGERICVNCVVSDAGYACSFFVCSCVALNQQWRSATLGVILIYLFIFNCRANKLI